MQNEKVKVLKYGGCGTSFVMSFDDILEAHKTFEGKKFFVIEHGMMTPHGRGTCGCPEVF